MSARRRYRLTEIEHRMTREALANTPEVQRQRRIRELYAEVSLRAAVWERQAIEGIGRELAYLDREYRIRKELS